MKITVYRKEYSYRSKSGKTVHVPACTYFRDIVQKEKVGAGSEHANTVLDRDAWQKKEHTYQGSFPKMSIAQKRTQRAVEFFESHPKFSAHELNRTLWTKKTAPVKVSNAQTYSWVKNHLPQYFERISQHPEFSKFNK